MVLLSSSLSLASTVVRGGSIGDGLDLSNIRVGEHTRYTRMVFHVNYSEGYGVELANTPANITGNYIFELDDTNLSIEATFSGFRSSSFELKDINSTRVESMTPLLGEEYADDSSLIYKIKLYKPSKIKAFILYKPSRIILDIFDAPIRVL